MRITLRLCTVIGLLVSMATISLRADTTPYLGRWQVDVPATLEASKKSPTYNAAEAEKTQAATSKKLGALLLTLTADKLAITEGSTSGSHTSTIAYTFKDTTKGVTTITSDFNGKVLAFTFTTLGPKQIRFSASASREFDDIVWTPAPPLPPKPALTIEDNLRAIQQAAEMYALENNTEAIPYDAIAKGGYFKPLQVVNGENYATVVIDLKNNSVSVNDKDGVTHTFKKP